MHNIRWHCDGGGIAGPVRAVAIPQSLTGLLDHFALTEFIPWTMQASRNLAAPLSLQEAPRRIESLDVANDFFCYGLLLCRAVCRTVRIVGAAFDQRPESEVSSVLRQIDTSARQHIVVMHHNGRPLQMTR